MPMILSHKNKFIFIKTRKVSGTSMEISLSQFRGKKLVLLEFYGVDFAPI